MKQKICKLKMLLRFYQNLFLSIIFLTSGVVLSAEKTLGILESTEAILKLDHLKLKKLYLKYIGSPKFVSNDKKIKKITIEENLRRSFILNSKTTYLNYAIGDNCKFAALLQSKIIKTSIGIPKNILVKIDYLNKSEIKLTPLSDYIKYTYNKYCSNYFQFFSLFNKDNIIGTVNSLDFKSPKNKKDCKKRFLKWRDNNYLPFLCSIAEDLTKGSYYNLKGINNKYTQNYNFYKKNISYYKRYYIKNLCKNLYNPKLFCSSYNEHLIWNDVINGKKPIFFLSYRCRRLSGKKNMTNQLLHSCTQKLKNSPEICSLKEGFEYYAGYPGPNCNQISKSLEFSRLKTNYYDCPANISNLALVNIYRIFNHFAKDKMIVKDENCVGNTYKTIYNLYRNYDAINKWPYKICYKDKIKDQQKCRHYIPGSEHGNDSEASVIAYILSRTNAAPENLQCKLINLKNYNPTFLKYKNGCFISKNKRACLNNECNKIIYYNTKKIDQFSYSNNSFFDYFKNSYGNANFTLNKMLTKRLKLKQKKIENLTYLKYFFKKDENIVHGIGCLEILKPHLKATHYLNQCTPIPFIIDGLDYKKHKVIIRLSSNDIHWPITIDWDIIFNAVKTYQQYHPEKLWSLYGIRR